MRQFRDWQFTKGAIDPPQEYIDFVLCHHVYHCTPYELDDQPAFLTGLHLEFWAEINQPEKKKRVLRRNRRRSGK